MIDVPPGHARECDGSLADTRCPACIWMLEQQALSRFVVLVRSWWQQPHGWGRQ